MGYIQLGEFEAKYLYTYLNRNRRRCIFSKTVPKTIIMFNFNLLEVHVLAVNMEPIVTYLHKVCNQADNTESNKQQRIQSYLPFLFILVFNRKHLQTHNHLSHN